LFEKEEHEKGRQQTLEELMSRNQRLTKEKEKISTQCEQLAAGTIMQVKQVKQIYSTYSSIQVSIE